MTNKDITDFKVTYKNVFNEVAIPDLTTDEENLLMTIMGKLDRQNEDEVTISFRDLPKLINTHMKGRPEEIISIIDSTWKKVKNVDYKLYAGNQSAGGVLLFSYLSANKDKQMLEVKINPDLKYFVNDFEEGRYSSLDYRDFKRTADKYGKLLFRQLNQRKNLHERNFKLEELAYLLDVAPAYRSSGSLMNKRVLRPAVKSLMPLMEYLTFDSIRTGRQITDYHFSFRFKNGPAITRKEIEAEEEEENAVDRHREIEKKIKAAKPKYENNFTKGYIPGQDAPITKYVKWLELVKFFTSNSGYFGYRNDARRQLQALYKEKVIDNDYPMWTDMTFLAAVTQLIKHDRPMLSGYLETSYGELKSGMTPLELSADIYDSLPIDKAKELFSFSMNFPIESVIKRDLPTNNMDY